MEQSRLSEQKLGEIVSLSNFCRHMLGSVTTQGHKHHQISLDINEYAEFGLLIQVIFMEYFHGFSSYSTYINVSWNSIALGDTASQ